MQKVLLMLLMQKILLSLLHVHVELIGGGIGLGNPYGAMERARWILAKEQLEVRLAQERNFELQRRIRGDLDTHLGYGCHYGWHSIC
jgi:hypothetical protein